LQSKIRTAVALPGGTHFSGMLIATKLIEKQEG
jgi:hypothetical protein